MYNTLVDAAGPDRILQTRELELYMRDKYAPHGEIMKDIEVAGMKKKISENNKKFYATDRGKEIKARGLETRRRNGVSQERREDQSNKIKSYWNSEKGMKRKEEIHKNALEQFHKKVTIVKYSLYDISSGEKVPVMENVGRIDMVRYFGVKGINVDKYVGTGAIYKGKYIIEKIVTEEVSKKTYYLKEIREGDLL